MEMYGHLPVYSRIQLIIRNIFCFTHWNIIRKLFEYSTVSSTKWKLSLSSISDFFEAMFQYCFNHSGEVSESTPYNIKVRENFNQGNTKSFMFWNDEEPLLMYRNIWLDELLAISSLFSRPLCHLFSWNKI